MTLLGEKSSKKQHLYIGYFNKARECITAQIEARDTPSAGEENAPRAYRISIAIERARVRVCSILLLTLCELLYMQDCARDGLFYTRACAAAGAIRRATDRKSNGAEINCYRVY